MTTSRIVYLILRQKDFRGLGLGVASLGVCKQRSYPGLGFSKAAMHIADSLLSPCSILYGRDCVPRCIVLVGHVRARISTDADTGSLYLVHYFVVPYQGVHLGVESRLTVP